MFKQFSRPTVALVLALWLGLGSATAQSPAQEPSGPSATTVTGGDASQSVPALVALGVSAGFPSYQTIAVAASFQMQFVGAQVKGSWTPGGPYFALQVRAYPPLDTPVPLYVGLGAGVYGTSVSYHAALGTHVPLGVALRLDAEAGIASVPLLDTRNWAPHLAFGLSYAFPVELTPGSTGRGSDSDGTEPARGSGCPVPRPPDEGTLVDAFERVLAAWLLSARATYGSVYTDLDYSYAVTTASVSDDRGTVEISYSGSVRAIGSGTIHEAEGSAEARFQWTGCSWSNTSVEY